MFLTGLRLMVTNPNRVKARGFGHHSVGFSTFLHPAPGGAGLCSTKGILGVMNKVLLRKLSSIYKTQIRLYQKPYSKLVTMFAVLALAGGVCSAGRAWGLRCRPLRRNEERAA
jgi:hypothetical protein